MPLQGRLFSGRVSRKKSPENPSIPLFNDEREIFNRLIMIECSSHDVYVDFL